MQGDRSEWVQTIDDEFVRGVIATDDGERVMKAVNKYAPGEGKVELLHIKKPACGETQVRLEISCCGVCRSDIHVWHDRYSRPHPGSWTRASNAEFYVRGQVHGNSTPVRQSKPDWHRVQYRYSGATGLCQSRLEA